jgi:hypothetical protein
MRARAVILVAALIVFATVLPAEAEKRTTEEIEVVAAPLTDLGAVPSLWDFSALTSLAEGSPVARRHERRMVKRRKRSKDVVRDAAVFRDTQHGKYDPLIADAAKHWGLDPFLLKGLLYNESKLDATLVGDRIYKKIGSKKVAVGGGARGIAQFTTSGIAAVNEAREKRHRLGERVHAFRATDVWQPELAIPAAAELLASYIRRFGRDGGITAYNSGPYGGRIVARLGFWSARDKLRKVGKTHIQGHRFLLNVIRRTNQFRRKSDLRGLQRPSRGKPAGPIRSSRPTT